MAECSVLRCVEPAAHVLLVNKPGGVLLLEAPFAKAIVARLQLARPGLGTGSAARSSWGPTQRDCPDRGGSSSGGPPPESCRVVGGVRPATLAGDEGEPAPVVAPAPGRPRRPDTVYECDSCGARTLGDQRCDTCGTFMRRVGLGGLCIHCDEPIAVNDLLPSDLLQASATPPGRGRAAGHRSPKPPRSGRVSPAPTKRRQS